MEGQSIKETNLRINKVGAYFIPSVSPTDCIICHQAEWGDVLINGVCGKCLISRLNKQIDEINVTMTVSKNGTVKLQTAKVTFVDLINEKIENENQWVPVNYRPPMPWTAILLSDGVNEWGMEGFYKPEDKQHQWYFSDGRVAYGITHWRLMPKAPTK